MNKDVCYERARRLAACRGIDLEVDAGAQDGYVMERRRGRPAVRARNPRSALWGVNQVLREGVGDLRARACRPLFAMRGINICESLQRHTDKQLERLFENLMMQFVLSCPQPNTGHLLNDVRLFEQIGLDGLLYEAFEPGMESFAAQLGVLSAAAWGEPVKYQASTLEIACEQFARERSSTDIFGRNMSPLKYLETDKFDGVALLRESWDDPVLIELVSMVTLFLLVQMVIGCCVMSKG